MAEDEEAERKPNPANADDEFLRHPDTGAFFRNPLRESAEKPVLMSLGEYQHNCLDNALSTWHSVSMPESVFRKMTIGAKHEDAAQSVDVKQKAALRRLDRVTGHYEYTVTVRKSQYIAPRGHRRNAQSQNPQAVALDKMSMDVVSEADGMRLRVEAVNDGLVGQWNKLNPFFAVRPGDYIVRVNGKRGNAASLIEDINGSEDLLKIAMQRVTNRTASRMSVYSTEQDMAAMQALASGSAA
eukprot:TRINITY_DN3405_c0_g1_i1.p1 TRINITY_DN3405_c0_g1~~TRINITY_DN3405_c0_g1_i1.p1  ORF type:complete len:241 (-),score=49.56 TRINITY_DN3405_c0_g1_i1:172-894(-)